LYCSKRGGGGVYKKKEVVIVKLDLEKALVR